MKAQEELLETLIRLYKFIEQNHKDGIIGKTTRTEVKRVIEKYSLKEFTLFWLDGKREVIKGYGIQDAINTTGYGGGAIRALDFHAEGDNIDYQWNKEKKKWEWNEEVKIQKFGIK